MNEYSDFIIFVDESGDHSLTKINPEYPLFVLAFCIFEKAHYIRDIVPAVLDLKYTYFGHELVILHEREMRKEKGCFDLLRNAEVRESFFHDLNEIMAQSQYRVVASIIDKREIENPQTSENLYTLGMRRGVSGVNAYLDEVEPLSRPADVIFESRGHKEDTEVERAFSQFVYDAELTHIRGMHTALKSANLVGLQIADLVARPLGNHFLHPEHHDRAYEILENRLQYV